VQNARYSFSASAVGVIGPASLNGVQRSLVQCSANGFCNQFSGQCDCNAGFGMWSSAARSCASCALWQRGWLRARALAPTWQAGWLAVTSHEQSLASCEHERSRPIHPLHTPRFDWWLMCLSVVEHYRCGPEGDACEIVSLDPQDPHKVGLLLWGLCVGERLISVSAYYLRNAIVFISLYFSAELGGLALPVFSGVPQGAGDVTELPGKSADHAVGQGLCT
jgi:hypothetical protein